MQSVCFPYIIRKMGGRATDEGSGITESKPKINNQKAEEDLVVVVPQLSFNFHFSQPIESDAQTEDRFFGSSVCLMHLFLFTHRVGE